MKTFINNIHPATLLLLGYLSYVAFGWLALSIPFMQETAVSSLDNLFIATSAVSTTGLVTIDVASHYSFWGELVILLCIQAGGIGYMTFGSFIMLALRDKLSAPQKTMVKNAFVIPSHIKPTHFVKLVVLYTFAIEILGAFLLWLVFINSDQAIDNPVWSAIFHSVSAFCTAGFSINSNSFESFANNAYLNIVIGLLSYLGAIGFIVIADLWQTSTNRCKHMHFSSKVILKITLWFSFAGMLLFFVIEPSIQTLAPWERLLAAFFQIMTAITTVGFNTIPIGELSMAVIMIMYFIMIFGASPSGTGGGLKSTTLAALIGLTKSILKGRSTIRFEKRNIDNQKIMLASASLSFYMAVLFIAMICLLLTETHAFDQVLFEAVSAMGTVGLSMGITGDLSVLGKLIIIILMFMGRVGILTFGIAISVHDESREEEADNELVL